MEGYLFLGSFVVSALLSIIGFVASVFLIAALMLWALRTSRIRSRRRRMGVPLGDSEAAAPSGQVSASHNVLPLLRAFPFGILIGLWANYQAFHGSLFLLRMTPGTTIRPMFEGFVEGVSVLVASLVGLPLSWLEIQRGLGAGAQIRVVLGAVGAILILASWFSGQVWWDYFAGLRHITFEE